MVRLARISVAVCIACTVLASPAAGSVTSFKSPSGNIHCVISGKGVRCDLKRRDWHPPPAPSTCDVDYGQGVSVSRRGPGEFVCAGDTTISPSNSQLGYGDRVKRGRFRCIATEREQETVRCVNRRNGHGFRLSANDVKLF